MQPASLPRSPCPGSTGSDAVRVVVIAADCCEWSTLIADYPELKRKAIDLQDERANVFCVLWARVLYGEMG